MKKICIFTSSRAEFGILSDFITELKKKFKIFFVVSGTHLLNNYGNTISEIKSKRIIINKLINYKVKRNDPNEILNNISLLISNFSRILNKNSVDLLIVLGDRYELLAPSIVATFYKIPICHIHGGEKTLSAIDDNIRHAVSKFSNLHFVATDSYRRRVIQLGEQPKYVHNIGSLSLDSLSKKKFLEKKEIEKELNFKLKQVNFLVTIHPETHLTDRQNLRNLKLLLDSIKQFPSYSFLFTSSNSDLLGNTFNIKIKEFCKRNSINTKFKYSLGSNIYLSYAKISNGVIGNSSSGIIEVSSLGTKTLNLGQRQFGRVHAKSVININFEKSKIIDNIKKLAKGKKKIYKNPYYKKNSIKNAIKILSHFKYKKTLIKKFYDIK